MMERPLKPTRTPRPTKTPTRTPTPSPTPTSTPSPTATPAEDPMDHVETSFTLLMQEMEAVCVPPQSDDVLRRTETCVWGAAKKELCQNCQEREATENWTGEGGTLAYVHGMYDRWCRVCVLRAQIAHIREANTRLPELEAELANLLGEVGVLRAERKEKAT